MTETLALGASPEADFIRQRVEKCSRLLQKSVAFGIEDAIRGELANVWEECSDPNWDGYNAIPVSQESYACTEQLLRSLPLGTPIPSIGAEPDGEITLEWGRSRRRTLSVSVSPDGDLHYAALLGPDRSCGTTIFFGEVPSIILDLIGEVC